MLMWEITPPLILLPVSARGWLQKGSRFCLSDKCIDAERAATAPERLMRSSIYVHSRSPIATSYRRRRNVISFLECKNKTEITFDL